MSTIKLFTDLPQSKKLTEILPLESSDMHYMSFRHKDDTIEWIPQLGTPTKYDIPCWSLAALIEIIPQEIFDGEYIINITEGIDNRWVLTYDHYENRNHSYYGLLIGADNLIDACYKMIIKLHKFNLL